MGNTIEQKINIKEVVDVRGAIKGINEIQDSLKKLSLGPGTQAEFNKLFQNIERQADKANTAIASGFKNRGDVKKYDDAMVQIANTYDTIIRKIELLKTKKDISLDVETKDLEKAKTEIDELQKKIRELQTVQKTANNTIMSVGKKREGNGNVASWQTLVDAYKKGDLQKATQALYVLKGMMTKAEKNPNIDFDNDKKWQSFAADYKKVEAALKEYADAENELAKTRQAHDDAINKSSQIVNNAKVVLEDTGKVAEESGDNFKKFAQGSSESAKSAQELNSELENFRNKAAYFFGIGNAINLLKRAIRSAYDTVKDLDAVMTETAVVTNFDVGDMWSQLPEYTERANELGVSIHSAYEAATIFYQQGLKTNEVMAVSNETLKMARIAGLDAATASDRMTNALRGFNMEMDQMSAQRVNDVYSELAAITASDTDEISTAMTKVASLAHSANMEFETTAAFLAQIIESTRESAETAGTALKTVVARFSEVKNLYSKGELLGQDEEGEEIDVNRVSTALRSAGINLNEYLTGAKGLDDIFMELAEKWDDLDIVQQRYIATMAAGSRQQSRFIALMSDYKRTMQLVDAANNANGASTEQYNKTLDSLETKLSRLKNAWDEFVLGLANSDAIKGAVDLLTKLITTINDLISKVSGKNAGVKMVTTFFTAFATFKVGSKLFRGTSLETFFSGLIKDGNGQAVKGAGAIADVFYSNLASKIANYSKSGGIPGSFKNIKNSAITKILDLKNLFTPVTEEMSVALNDFIKGDVERLNLTGDQQDEIWNAFNSGKTTIKDFNEILQKNGIQFKITKENAAQFGIAMKDDNTIVKNAATEMRTCAAVATGLGAAFYGLGSWLEEQDGLLGDFGTAIKYLGGGLTVFGTIMSVTLPLQAKIGAEGISSAIYSIPIVGWITLIISLVVALGVAIHKLVNDNSAEAKFEKAATAAENAAKAAEEAKEAYEKLGEAWDNLSDKYDAIENATEGTREWRDAVTEVNDAVLELMDTYKGIKIKRDANGILTIENQDEIDEQYRKEASVSKVNEGLTRIKKVDTAQNLRYDNAAFEKTIDRLGDSIVDYIGADEDTIRELLKADYYGENTRITDSEIEEFRQYVRDFQANQIELSSAKTAFGASLLNSVRIDEDSVKNADALVSSEFVDKIIEDTKDNFGNAMDGDIRDRYAQAHSYESYEQMEKENPDVKDIDIEEMRDYLISQDILTETENRINTFTDNLDKLNNTEKALFEGQTGSALNKDQISVLRGENIEDLYKKLGGDEVYGENGLATFTQWFNNSLTEAASNFDLSSFSQEFINNLKGNLINGLSSGSYNGLVNNLWSVYATSGEESMNKIQESIKNMTEGMDSNEIDNFVKSINSVDWSSAESIKTLDDLAEQYDISKESIKAFENQIIELNKATAQFDPEKLKEALGIAKEIDNGKQGRSFSEEKYNELIARGANPDDFVFNIETGAYDYIGQDLQDIKAALIEQTNIMVGQLKNDIANGEAFKKAEELLGSPDTGNPESLKKFLAQYIYAAGDNAIFDYSLLQTNDTDKLLDAYYKIEALANELPANQQKLGQAQQESYQLNSGTMNAGLATKGNEDAAEALIAQLANTGMSEDLRSDLIGKKDYQSMGAVVDTFDEASRIGIDAETLNSYADALRQVNGLEDEEIGTIYELALADARLQEGLTGIIDSYDKWIQLENEDGSLSPQDGSEEQIEAYSNLKKTLAEMLNVSEDVADTFLGSAGAAELLEGAVNGDTDAVDGLRVALAKIKLDKMLDAGDISKDAKDEIVNAFNGLATEMPDLEIGAKLNETQFGQSLMDAVNAAGLTVEEMQALFDALGWAPELEWEKMTWADAQKSNQTGYLEVPDPNNPGETIKTKISGEQEISGDTEVLVPKIGNATFVKPSMPSMSSSSKSSGGGGGGGGGSSKSEKKSYWENPYDELYNLQEKINEALRTREALERRYQKLLKQEQATLTDIRKAYYSQINNLRTEADLQKQFAAGRLNQINKVGSQIYTDEDGNRRTFSSMGVTKYASYDANTGLISIDWNGLEAIANDSSREEEGKAAEAYISKLEELVESYEEVRDKLWDIEDEIEDLRETAIESYLSFEDRVMEGLVASYQQQIDSYQAMSDAIENSNNEVIDSLREQIDLTRQIRDNTEKENEISEMENRLAYLQRDTSGANDLEILKLQKDLDDARQDYTDSLIDQAIDEMQKDADLAAEQRARQIETMNEQLQIMQDTGALWQQVYDLMDEAASGDGALSPKSKLVELLKATEAYDSLSNIGQAKWWGEVAEEFHAAWVGRGEAEDKYKKDANNDGVIFDSNTQKTIDNVSNTAVSAQPAASTTSSKPNYDEKTKYGVALAVCDGYWGNGQTRKNNLESKGFNYSEIQSIVNKVLKDSQSGAWYGKYYGIKDISPYKMSKFKTGGLADFTGPAWLDGTKTNPELVLNAQDSRNFITLKDILASLLNTQGVKKSNGGDNYFDINISANIGSDYDVDQLKEKIKEDIYKDGQYRNVNTLNFLR